MTLDQLVQLIYRKWESSTDYPTSGDEEYELITGAINEAIQSWGGKANEENFKWKELFVNLSSAATGDKTTTSGDNTYACPTDFVHISSFVKVTAADGTYVIYPYKKQDDVLRALTDNSSERFFYITGNEDTGYSIVLNPTPTITGSTISYSYYKSPKELSASSDKIEMPKPYFAVYHSLSSLLLDERPDLAQFYLTKAKGVLDSMIIDNEIPPFNHNFTLEDTDYKVNGISFGV